MIMSNLDLWTVVRNVFVVPVGRGWRLEVGRTCMVTALMPKVVNTGNLLATAEGGFVGLLFCPARC